MVRLQVLVQISDGRVTDYSEMGGLQITRRWELTTGKFRLMWINAWLYGETVIVPRHVNLGQGVEDDNS